MSRYGNCPPGLEYLAKTDQVLVHQEVQIYQVVQHIPIPNRYYINNNLGQTIYFAAEVSDKCMRCCFGPIRPFNIKIVDNSGNDVLDIHRKLACDNCCFPCCLQRMEVSSHSGTLMGTIKQRWSICRPKFTIKDGAGDIAFRILGPIFTTPCCRSNVEFDILTADELEKVGKITTQWPGWVTTTCTNTDVFGISFPIGLDVRIKAVILGAYFLIDYIYYKSKINPPI